ncbi:hypothetical protein Pth03_53180 [Planotetraspora thailandica]|uniref:DUF1440 domain-containing protein n=1 Tax=Planotetraspora thailandica TaxID=487172 RepID=A0A8J3XXQ3_9ACTN|nr:hypothetical protein [Planotetraspora thailandica]GII56929.1 hypothetical protein Pth03_53180 [Planotetraspora thailandica]
MTRNLVNGAVGGALATAVYSAVLMAGDRAGLVGDPSREVAPRWFTRITPAGRTSRSGESVLTTIGQFLYGSAAGAALGMLGGGRRVPLVMGAAYGLAVWYAGRRRLVPRMGGLPASYREVPGRQALLALGHMMYGASLAISMNRLRPDKAALGPVMPAEGYDPRSKFLTPRQQVP